MHWQVSTHPSIWGTFCKIFGKSLCTCKWLWKHQRLNSRALSLDGGLFVYNKSRQPSLPFLKYSTFVILGTLDMPEHAITQLVKNVVSILNYGGVSASKKKLWQFKLSLLRYWRFAILDTLGIDGTSSQHQTKSRVLSGALEVYLHTKIENNPPCLS